MLILIDQTSRCPGFLELLYFFVLQFQGPPSEWVRGNASNIPFWPGGLEWNPSEAMADLLQMDEILEELNFKKGKRMLVKLFCYVKYILYIYFE